MCAFQHLSKAGLRLEAYDHWLEKPAPLKLPGRYTLPIILLQLGSILPIIQLVTMRFQSLVPPA